MINLNILFLFFCIWSCGNFSRVKNKVAMEKFMYARIEKFPVKTQDEALRLIKNKTNFLKLFFEQSRDPYYGTPKWTEDCLEVNQIGEVLMSETTIASISNVLLDDKGNVGICPGHRPAFRSHVIYFYCTGDDHITSAKYPIHKNPVLTLDTLCK